MNSFTKQVHYVVSLDLLFLVRGGVGMTQDGGPLRRQRGPLGLFTIERYTSKRDGHGLW